MALLRDEAVVHVESRSHGSAGGALDHAGALRPYGRGGDPPAPGGRRRRAGARRSKDLPRRRAPPTRRDARPRPLPPRRQLHLYDIPFRRHLDDRVPEPRLRRARAGSRLLLLPAPRRPEEKDRVAGDQTETRIHYARALHRFHHLHHRGVRAGRGRSADRRGDGPIDKGEAQHHHPCERRTERREHVGLRVRSRDDPLHRGSGGARALLRELLRQRRHIGRLDRLYVHRAAPDTYEARLSARHPAGPGPVPASAGDPQGARLPQPRHQHQALRGSLRSQHAEGLRSGELQGAQVDEQRPLAPPRLPFRPGARILRLRDERPDNEQAPPRLPGARDG